MAPGKSYSDMKRSVKKSVKEGGCKTYPDVILKDMKNVKIQLYVFDTGKQVNGWRTVVRDATPLAKCYVRDGNSDVGFRGSGGGSVILANFKK
ncbi:hypothetical protein TrVE_jg4745 [Triparma verrucosa]|uniref:Uncharacterized protein n=1 Tax=Triparma verrucosa TaxID=1606542 RepID=A0A9W7CEB1_9STRA|nr:hypothetical protein TrVE_jg4745 [Triparma verrucosa]